jgi:hypothetical protein
VHSLDCWYATVVSCARHLGRSMIVKIYYLAGIGAVLASVLWLVIGQFLHNTRGALEAGGSWASSR